MHTPVIRRDCQTGTLGKVIPRKHYQQKTARISEIPKVIRERQDKYGANGFAGYAAGFQPERTSELDTICLLLEKSKKLSDISQALEQEKKAGQDITDKLIRLYNEKNELFEAIPRLRAEVKEKRTRLTAMELLEVPGTTATGLQEEYDTKVKRYDLLKTGLPTVGQISHEAKEYIEFLQKEQAVTTHLNAYHASLKKLKQYAESHTFHERDLIGDRLSTTGGLFKLYKSLLSTAEKVGRKAQAKRFWADLHNTLTGY